VLEIACNTVISGMMSFLQLEYSHLPCTLAETNCGRKLSKYRVCQ